VAKLNDTIIKALPVPETGNKVYRFAGAVLQGVPVPPGFGICLTPNDARSGILDYRDRVRRQRRLTIGQWPTWTALQLVKEARELRRRIDRGEDPLGERRRLKGARENTFRAVAKDFFKREGNKLRSGEPRRRALERLAYPAIGDEDIAEIKRTDLVRLLDKVEDENGPVMATRLLAYIGRIFNWHASRVDEFRSPIVRGMARSSATERARARVLNDDELSAIWKAAEASRSPFSRMVRFILLTGARRSEAAQMARSELQGRDWTLPAARNKTKLDLLRPLSSQAFALLPTGDDKLVFGIVFGTMRNFTRHLEQLHKASGTSDWTLHDLRRTARTLMSRGGVASDIAERCLGHVLPGVRGIYDRHEYAEEKRRAYDALAALIERIVNPPAENVTPLRKEA
jgi:integrase